MVELNSVKQSLHFSKFVLENNNESRIHSGNIFYSACTCRKIQWLIAAKSENNSSSSFIFLKKNKIKKKKKKKNHRCVTILPNFTHKHTPVW